VPVTSLCALISVAGKFDSHIALYLPPNGFVSFTQDFLSLAFLMIVLIVYAAILAILLARRARCFRAVSARCEQWVQGRLSGYGVVQCRSHVSIG